MGIPNLSMQVKIQPTYLTLGVDVCMYGPFFLSHYKSSHTPTSGSCRENLEKRQIEDHRRQKEEKNFGGKREYNRKEEPLTT